MLVLPKESEEQVAFVFVFIFQNMGILNSCGWEGDCTTLKNIFLYDTPIIYPEECLSQCPAITHGIVGSEESQTFDSYILGVSSDFKELDFGKVTALSVLQQVK